MDKSVKKKLLTGGQKLASSLRIDLDGELVVKTLFALRRHTPKRFDMLNAILNH